MARDMSKTGAGNGSQSKYIKLNSKEGKFELPDGTQASEFVGYMDRIDMEFQDADSQHDLPARWSIKLGITAALPGDPPDGAQYTIPLYSHWNNPILSNLMNGIAGAMEDNRWSDPKDRYLRIWLNLKTPVGKRQFCSALGFISGAKGDFLPNKYQWNEGARNYEGVPADLDEAGKFWLGVAHGLCKMTGGVVIGADKATIPLPAANVSLAIPAAPADADSLISKAIGFFDGALQTGMAFGEAVKQTFVVLNKKGASPVDFSTVAFHCTKAGLDGGHIPDGHISPQGDWKRPEFETDDLPF